MLVCGKPLFCLETDRKSAVFSLSRTQSLSRDPPAAAWKVPQDRVTREGGGSSRSLNQAFNAVSTSSSIFLASPNSMRLFSL